MAAALTATGLDIVKKAFNILGAIDKTIPLNSELRETGFTALNFLVKSLQVTYHLWTETQAIIPLKTGVIEYKLGPGGTEAANKDEFLKLSTDSLSGVGFTVNVTGDISANDTIGFIHDNGSIQWTTVVSYTAGAAVITDSLTAILPANSTTYVFTNLLDRPIKIVNSRYQSTLTSGDTPTTKWNSTQYYESEDKTVTGSVQAWYYSPQITDGILSIYKAPLNNTSLLNVTYIRPINITVDNGDNVDFPSEWFLPLSYMLAEQMGPEIDTPDQSWDAITTLSAKYAAMVGVVPLGKLQPIPEAGA
jgi:hypothetical protein